jgi:hypothetical protein
MSNLDKELNPQNDFQWQSQCRPIDQEAMVNEDGLSTIGTSAIQRVNRTT